MTSLINFSVNNPRLSVAPGASVEMGVTVQNLTTLLDQVAVRLTGVDPTWVQVIPPQVPIFSQSEASARVVISPPNDMAASAAGIYTIQVSGASQENPGQEGQTTTELEIQLVGDYQLRVDGSSTTGGPGAGYPIVVMNASNASLQISFSGSDAGNALWYKFEPFELTVPPGSNGTATLTVRPKSTSTDTRNVTFNLATQGKYVLKGGSQSEAPKHQLAGQFNKAAPSALTLSLRPAPAKDKSSGVFEIRVGNPNLSPVAIRLEGKSNSGNLIFEFAPADLTLAAQNSNRSMLVVRPTSASTIMAPGGEPFRVSAVLVSGDALPVSADATYAPLAVPQPSSIPMWLILVIIFLGFVLTLIILLALAIGLGLFR